MRKLRRTLLLPILVLGLVAAGCSDDDGGGGGGDAAAFCDLVTGLEDSPSPDQLDEMRDLAPSDISDAVDTVLDAFETGDFSDEDALAASEAISDWGVANCEGAEE